MTLRTFALVFFSLTFFNSNAQSKEVTSYSYKKGEILDVMLLTMVSDSKEKFDTYKKTIYPVGYEYSYRPQNGFRISKLTLGTHLPSNLIFGKWENKQKREAFLANISKRVPDFHKQRRELFPYFDLTYYEMQKDVSFSINKKKYNVVTSFWKDNSNEFNKFVSNWEEKIKKAGGKIVLQLNKGNSPTGYVYNPDKFYIIEWKNQSVFEAFAVAHSMTSYDDLKNVHQFKID
ncbi:hypothetical protein [Aquimarina aquimarini]|uniref:hypothetical protein n=1 Tax=Aquimarina aquimarini TaxID=1191734 RepID=UPI000D5589B6|nr:hypothetical protein [Aquimarina aquimarini]